MGQLIEAPTRTTIDELHYPVDWWEGSLGRCYCRTTVILLLLLVAHHSNA